MAPPRDPFASPDASFQIGLDSRDQPGAMRAPDDYYESLVSLLTPDEADFLSNLPPEAVADPTFADHPLFQSITGKLAAAPTWEPQAPTPPDPRIPRGGALDAVRALGLDSHETWTGPQQEDAPSWTDRVGGNPFDLATMLTTSLKAGQAHAPGVLDIIRGATAPLASASGQAFGALVDSPINEALDWRTAGRAAATDLSRTLPGTGKIIVEAPDAPPVTTANEQLAKRGIHLPPGVGFGLDLLADPSNYVGGTPADLPRLAVGLTGLAGKALLAKGGQAVLAAGLLHPKLVAKIGEMLPNFAKALGEFQSSATALREYRGQHPRVEVTRLDPGTAGAYQMATGRVMLDRDTISRMSPAERAQLVRHELAHLVESEHDLWQQSDTTLWKLWEQDRKHPIWDFLAERTGKVRFGNDLSPEVIAELYATEYPKGTFTVKDRPVPYAHEAGGPGPHEYPIPPDLMAVLDKIEAELGIWAKRGERGPSLAPLTAAQASEVAALFPGKEKLSTAAILKRVLDAPGLSQEASEALAQAALDLGDRKIKADELVTLVQRPGAVAAAVAEAVAQDAADANHLHVAPAAFTPEGYLEVSTRVPKGKKAALATDGVPLTTGADTLAQSATVPEKIAERIQSSPLLTKAESKLPVARRLDLFTQRLADNLVWLWDKTDDWARGHSREWYVGAHALAKREAAKFGLKLEQMTGVIAVLSPQKEWFSNVEVARRVTALWHEFKGTNPEFTQEIFDKYRDLTRTSARRSKSYTNIGKAEKAAYLEDALAGVKKADRKAAELAVKRRDEYKAFGAEKRAAYLAAVDREVALEEAQYVGRSFNALPTDGKSRFIRAYSEKNHSSDFRELLPDGSEGDWIVNDDGVTRSKLAWNSYGMLDSAISVLEDGSAANISLQLGDGHKVRSFHLNMTNPWNAVATTMDTHAVAAAHISPFSQEAPEVAYVMGGVKDDALGINGANGLYADAYRRAAAIIGARTGETVLAREVQSVVWEAVRGLFTDVQKGPGSTLPAEVAALWNQHRSGKMTIDEVRNAIHDLASRDRGGQIAPPAWTKTVRAREAAGKTTP